MAGFVMQSLGCEVAALNTVNFSNHLGYGQAKGRKTPASEVTDMYQGLKDSHLDDFNMMLSGYLPGAEVVEAVAIMARELKYKATMKPGSFFWILDPVMGDNGRLYVAEDVVPAYKNMIKDADLILPNQFEAEYGRYPYLRVILLTFYRTLSGVKITDMDSLKQAITTLHETYRIPHIIVTSIPSLAGPGAEPSLSVVGSTITSNGKPRIFGIKVPQLDCFFSGTGDMFAALMLVRLREAAYNTEGLSETDSWVSADEVEAVDLPLACAAEKVLASMQGVLARTKAKGDLEMEKFYAKDVEVDEKELRLIKSKAYEVRMVRNLDCLMNPEITYKAETV
ncbi:ribokinase-like protein [Coleophoma cylindrospora]|uniref:pyridoxal kinase n=1 Tax=Coleophoma cylindrospora TaxID=1849047 RepID=A0A3D8R119_9HELO|nr:ribokinase-like protein [Coleophoma cylindrospora]